MFKNNMVNIKVLSNTVPICQIQATDAKIHVHGSKFKKFVAEGHTQWTDLQGNIRPKTFTQMTGTGYNTSHV